MSDSQLVLVVELARRLGLLRDCVAANDTLTTDIRVSNDPVSMTTTSAEETPTVYGYPSLSGRRLLYVTLADQLPTKRPVRQRSCSCSCLSACLLIRLQHKLLI